MSLDGSFTCESALERFLARCPRLQNNPKLIALTQKGDSLTDDEVVNSLAELFLHPNYTISLLGCFRPINRKIVDRAVDLLRLVPNFKSHSVDAVEEISEDEIRVIDFFVRGGRGLELHELASLAFCRALDLAPFLLRSILIYFNFAPPPFQRLLMMDSAPYLTEKGIPHLLNVFRVSFRFLLMEPKVFSELWDWSCFLVLVQLSANLDLRTDSMFCKDVLDMRWCGIQILSIILRISDRATVNFGLGAEEALTCLFRWEEFCQDVSLEKAGFYLEATKLETGSLDEIVDFSEQLGLHSFEDRPVAISKIEPIRRNRRQATCDVKSVEIPFALTSAVKKSLEMVQLAVSQKWPVLLHGPVGAGKTALINKLAQVRGNKVLFIHMDEQLDIKTLIGSYICMEKPGEFRWQPGSLTQAVLNGFWVVFEDLDKAPSELQSILLPLLEGASSFVTGRGEEINVKEGFQLFATVSSSKHNFTHSAEGRSSLCVLWRKVMIGPASNQDLLAIINAWYPNLEPLGERLIETFESVNAVVPYQLGGSQVGTSSVRTFSRFLLRDLLKWCKRITGLGYDVSGLALSASICKSIYIEAVDIFAASSASPEIRLSIMKEIAKLWGVPRSEAETLYPPNKPIIRNLLSGLQVGRIILEAAQTAFRHERRAFVDLRSSLQVLERIACSVKYNEPVLLVGETGTGKTTLVQNLAMRLGHQVTVLNLSQQSDAADLLGGFKPTDARSICFPLYQEFKELFRKTFSGKDNEEFLRRSEIFVMEKKWRRLFDAFEKAVTCSFRVLGESGDTAKRAKRKRPLAEEVLHGWESFSMRLDSAHKQIFASTSMSFSFIEGAFITALKKGYWILLDEVNLAPPETLQRIIGVLEGDKGSLCLAERGDVDYIFRHPDFRVFACMNPATDAGKRDLPYSLRGRFTEYFVDDVVDDEDLILFINQYMDDVHSNREIVDRIVRFYKDARRESGNRLLDGANQKPQFSLRSLARALEYTRKAAKKFGFHKALYDGFCMFFLTLLDAQSAKLMNNIILSYLFAGNMPPNIPFDSYFVESEKYKELPKSDTFLENYVLTRSIKEHLRNLARAAFIKRYPVLLQGPTSSGKTSLVRYLAAITGHEFVRINNHEHTDLQEYFGSYITDSRGKLAFQEGVLVKAVRNGHWIVLDELNLAPSDVLEALNRLLDDNRELFVPELQEIVTAHPDFMLFATQNPPTLYGGRKMLSRAFRNRFLEIHVDEIPEDELSTILEKRCKIPESYAMKMVDVMKDLQLHRQSSKVFAGKHGFITPRDLFRWADRFRIFGNSYEDLAKDGYFLLAERLRDESEKNVVQEILERRLRVKFIKDELYSQEYTRLDAVLELCKRSDVLETLGKIIWTRSMRKLYFLIERCYKLREPVLLVGETGGGKTTVCQLLSLALRSRLVTLNCHQYTETSDFLGAFYPVRDRSKLAIEFVDKVEKVKLSKVFLHFSNDIIISSDIKQASSTLDLLNQISNCYKLDAASHPVVTQPDIDAFEQAKVELFQLQQKWQTLFLWQDGPLVQAMKDGSLFLVDEISLADDSVLERLNSVLEPERKLSLAEKGGSVLEEITAHLNFFLLATMNPGGDYGKKELSPALRNRFTEIWVPPVTDLDELKCIAAERFFKSELQWIADPMLKFWEWFNRLQTGRMLTVRDLLSWVAFINATERSLGANFSFIHGAFLVLLDGLSLGTGLSRDEAGKLRERGLSFLLEQLKMGDAGLFDTQFSKLEVYGWGDAGRSADTICYNTVQSDNLFGVNPFYIAKGDKDCKRDRFEFLAPTTCRNVLRVLRAMQLPKPVLLEGSPGVGKTSLVVALANFSGHTVVRINLSEQTDIMDLLGSDLPAEDEKGMKFAWSDGILLQALKNGSWVLLDELNLAPQSVLEGLNAILDHRAEVYIPELGLTFKCPPSFRVFACQNPSSQGGGRKGLPKSFLNRFTKVYVDELVDDDYLSICNSLHPSISKPLLSKLIYFNNRLYEDTMVYRKYGQDGSPWEFNLRDVIRSCQIIEGAPEKSKVDCFLSTVYIQRMRTETDRREVLKLYEEIFGVTPFINPCPRVQINPQYLSVGNPFVERNHYQPTKILQNQLHLLSGFGHSLEAALNCVHHEWLCIMVGPSSSGKTSLIRLLSQLTGNVLNELNLSSGTDNSELLGCFEQYDAFRNLRAVIAKVERYIAEYSSLRLVSSPEGLTAGSRELIARWLSFLSSINYSSSMSSFDSAFGESWKSGSCNMLGQLVEIIKQLQHDLEKYKLPVSMSHRDLNKSLNTILELHENSRTQSFSSKFEWVTGSLIKAVERGEWVILENANLCNPTVLDRINSLVEPTRSITVNECGLVDGKPVTLHAHPNFRMFLTVNPRYGEVSRAMRNRGVEVFVMQSDWLHRLNGYDCKETEARNVERFLVLSGIPISKLVVAMGKSHIYARDAGLHLGIHITLLELTRWVQLFQQFLMTGNRLTWSLQLSWEHTYLSSLGEAEGRDIIMHAKHSYLSGSEASELDLLVGCSLSLPGGWPEPLKFRNFLFFSRESCIKQNVMYLEFLGAQCASYELNVDSNGSVMIQAGSITATGDMQTLLLKNSKKLKPFVIPFKMLHSILFPTASSQQNFRCNEHAKFDLALANKMLFFAANWTIEQATESDLLLYDLWFNWYSTQLHPYCSFFKSFLAILKQERDWSIWRYIVDCWREIVSFLQINVDTQPIPLLSFDLVELAASNEALKSYQMRLYNAIRSVSLLRLSLQQWNSEDHYVYGEEKIHFSILPVLKSLRQLEEGVLNVIVESPCFDILIQLYNRLLEYHTLFWKGITMSQFEGLLISWRSLKKVAIKFHGVFPEGVDTFLVESRNLDKLSYWNFNSPKPMLWIYGGHPFLPSSADIYSKMLHLVSFCDVVWPKTMISRKQENDCLVEAVVSTNAELRYLAMQGVCMSSYIISKGGQDDTAIVHQLEEMYQMLLGWYEFEKQKLEAVLVSTAQFPNALLVESTASACCTFCPEMLCRKPGFDSWLDTLPLLDRKSFLLDLVLLQELSKNLLVDASELYLVLSKSSKLLEYVMNFSLSYSSRPPTDFSPHQKLLWMLDAWSSVDSVSTKVACFILELWFRWHRSLWSCCSKSLKNVSQIDYKEVPLPCILFQPTKTATLDQILRGTFPIKDYPVHSLKLRVASRNIWQDAPLEKDLPSILLSTARSLFQQIIFAHKKSFSKDEFGEIQSFFGSIEENPMTEEKLETLKSLIKSSNHSGLASLMETFIEPLLRELYFKFSSNGYLFNLALAWLHIGGLRFYLLLNADDLDPSMKYAFKNSQLQEKISLLELEIKVRQECDNLAGRNSARDDQKQRISSIEKLKIEQERLQTKVVFRSDPAKFKKLKSECVDFLDLVASSAILAKNLESGDMNFQLMIDQACNWQETSARFINRLSEEYAMYADIVQPVQVAIYELKLGVSLLVSSSYQRAFLDKVVEENMDRILETICSFMQFPRGCEDEPISIKVNTIQHELSCNLDVSENIWLKDMDLLKKIFSTPRDTSPDKATSVLQLHATIYHIIFVRVAQHVSSSLLMDDASFLLLNEVFDQFASLWMHMKVQARVKEDDDAQHYKFRPRAVKIGDIIEVGISALRNFPPEESLSSEWQEMLAEQEITEEASKEHENLEDEWNLIQESILRNMVRIHNRLFGSSNLVEHPGAFQVTNEDKLHSFIDSYKLGTRMIQDLHALSATTLDASLMPEHLLYLSLEYEQKFGPCHQSACVYNIYKDPNAPAMAKMIQPLTTLLEKLISLLNEWPEHPGLQKILDVTEMLLAIPLDTPLAKPLFGLQLLLSRAQLLQENASKFSLSVQLQPIFVLVSSWQKMELDCWPSLLDGVQEQYEVNARKLWFPLHSVIHRELSGGTDGDNISTIQSLEEFIQTASVGEFKSRLELLLAFHGQFYTSICLNSNSSPHVTENLKILYNVFGYYVQFLPLIIEHIEASRRSVETDIKELLKLCKWEHSHCYLLVESSNRTRRKLWKLVQKFNEILQQPLMVILDQEAAKKGIKVPALLETKLFNETHVMNVEMLTATAELSRFSDTERFRSLWYGDWRKKVDSALQDLHSGVTSGFDFPYTSFRSCKDVANLVSQFLSSGFALHIYQEGWITLEKICRHSTACSHLWKDGTNNLQKRRALSDLLKLLERCGLSKHKSMIAKAEFKSNQLSSWFLQPSYDVKHLLLPPDRTSTGNINITLSSHSCKFPDESFDSNWEMANRFYFKSMAMVQHLRQICLSFHKDFTLEQVKRSSSFLDHLIIIQQEQRYAAYGFAEQLRNLRRLTPLQDLDHGTGTGCSVSPNQHDINKCMWQQKKLFDCLYSISNDASLLLKTVENAHLNTCNSVRVEANKVSVFIDKFIQHFHKSKESLDKYLLGCKGILTTPAACSSPFIVSRQMEELVMHNFQVIHDFEEELQTFCQHSLEGRSVKEPLLSRFRDCINKAKVIMEEHHAESNPKYQLMTIPEEDACYTEVFNRLNASFAERFEEAIKQIISAFERLGSVGKCHTSDDLSMGNIVSWKIQFESCTTALGIDLIYDAVVKTLAVAVELANHGGCREPDTRSQLEIYLNHLHVLMDLLLTIGDRLLFEFLAMHKTVAEMTYMLANIFSSLYSRGFGAAEDQVDNTGGDISQDASGTGMGEGEGLNDVSDQIDDEAQLLGTSEKEREGQDASDKVPNKNNKGIEMDQDFAGDTFSVSEDSADDDSECSEDVNLESVMGETGDGSEIVDEKLWNKNEDDNPDKTIEKYEPGPSFKETDSSSRELRAKEDDAIMDDSGKLNHDESNGLSDNGENADVADDDNTNDMNMDKEAAFADPSGIQLDDQNQGSEDTGIGEPEGSDTMDEAADLDTKESAEDMGDEDGKTNSIDEDMDKENSTQVDEKLDTDEQGLEHAESTEMDVVPTGKEAIDSEVLDLPDDLVQDSDSAKPMNDSGAADTTLAPEMRWSNSSDFQNGLAPSRGLPSSDVPEMEMDVPDSNKDGKLTVDREKIQSPHQDTSSVQRAQSNPYRCVGDALEEWKERIKVSVDSDKHKSEGPDDAQDENANEYGFVTKLEDGTSQALGPATSDQIDKNMRDAKPDAEESLAKHNKDADEMGVEREEESETHFVKSSSAYTPKQKTNEHLQSTVFTNETHMEDSLEIDDCQEDMSHDLVSVNDSYMDNILQLSNLSMSGDELEKARNVEEISGDMKQNATALWRRYELITTRLSQELAEQLRLVMEPTLAGKLQGDYKTGKRINMKKVIPYIASHFRKDKIWLRRTRPNKRDYQVVIAVDDSRSMSESRCGNFAVEALVTVCRAMSQLEVGQLAVASFGEKGNIKLLHDFDKPFTGDAGVKMISSFSFKQDNTIADEPVVDLLRYLNAMLDNAVASARLPSGQNPLQQLILIIADGRFHEKENLKRCVRDVLSRKRMIAFLLLDSPQESIMDLMEASFQGEKLTFSKYLNSFPFPYYIILKNIEALPSTLADLLRQWFELMQNAWE